MEANRADASKAFFVIALQLNMDSFLLLIPSSCHYCFAYVMLLCISYYSGGSWRADKLDQNGIQV
jgi:hypothetical protein